MMFKQSIWFLAGVSLAFTIAAPRAAGAQGVTASAITGVVKDGQGLAVPGATVVAVHEPSGTIYRVVSLGDGRFAIDGMRVGGPYSVTATLEGFQPQTRADVHLNLGIATDVGLTLGTVATAEEITVTAASDAVFSSARTGAATTVARDALAALPTFEGRLTSYVRLTPQSTGGMSFAGQDNRLNNITVDGSYFNNSFGLGGAPGDRTGVAPISVQAIEEVQVNVAPYDVRQGNFVGAGVNTVTRSGTNAMRGSGYFQFRNDGLVGSKVGESSFDPGTFEYRNYGVWAGGPIRQNQAFFFVNLEDEALTEPGTTWRANNGTEPVTGQVTRVLASDLDGLSALLSSQFGYETGVYQGYDHQVPATRFILKSDLNLNPTNRISLRYTHLDSSTDVPLSNSGSLGFGTRRSNSNGLNFRNSNYKILENIRSFIGEWNTVVGSAANTLVAGYTHQDESRDSLGTFFPMVDILQGSSVYTTFGFEPFTPNNELRYGTFQVQDNLTWYRDRHSLTAGLSLERYESENIFFPGSQSVYVYNSLDDFLVDAADFAANPDRTVSPVTLRRFQVRWMNIPGLDKPVQPLEVWYSSLYAQDVWRPLANLTVTYGIRMDLPVFGDTAFANADADALTFRDAAGNPIQYDTGALPDAHPLWSPRVGFNWDLADDRQTQIRGGSGVFTGKPAYVWISNQIGNTGVLTGFEQVENTTARPFHPDPNHYKPTDVTGEPAASYELALTETDFRFPQVWRSNVAVDRRLPWGLVGTVEALYSRDINGISYINANLPAPTGAFAGVDDRPRWVGANANRIHAHVANAIVLGNQNDGSAWNVSTTLERPYRNGLWVKGAYSYGEARNTVSPGFIASGSWFGNQHPGDPNNPALGFQHQGHRVFLSATLVKPWLPIGDTAISVYWQMGNRGNSSYVFSGDANGDGSSNNDLIYVPRDVSEMNFVTFTSGGRVFTADEQAAAWDAYIRQDAYLRSRRGQYAERGGVRLPMVSSMDFSISQNIGANIGGGRNALQIRFDVLNFNNLLNSDWGIGQGLVSSSPLTNPGASADGRLSYRLRVVNGELMDTSFQKSPGTGDLWRMQFTLRYTFN